MITTLQWIWILFMFLCVFSFKIFFFVLFLCLQRFFSFHSYKHSSVFFQLSLHHPKKMEGFFCDMVGCCQGTISRFAFPSQSRKGMVKSVDLFGFYPFSCLSAYVVNNMKWEPRRILLLTQGVHDEHKKWCGMKDWDSVSLDAQTQCVSLLLVLFQLYWLSLTFPEWYAFLILFSLGLIPPWPSYSCLCWLLFFFFLLHFIYRMSITVKIVSRRIAETRSLTPDQATVARKTPFIRNKLWAGPGSFRGGACCWWFNKRSNCIHLHFSAKGSITEHLEWNMAETPPEKTSWTDAQSITGVITMLFLCCLIPTCYWKWNSNFAKKLVALSSTSSLHPNSLT